MMAEHSAFVWLVKMAKVSFNLPLCLHAQKAQSKGLPLAISVLPRVVPALIGRCGQVSANPQIRCPKDHSVFKNAFQLRNC